VFGIFTAISWEVMLYTKAVWRLILPVLTRRGFLYGFSWSEVTIRRDA